MQLKDLSENVEFVEKNKEKLLKEHFNKYLLVYHKKLIRAFDTYEKAARAGVKKYGSEGNFLVYHALETEPLNIVYSAAR
jgi:hypothetical protein